MENKTKKALFIDPTSRKITEVEINDFTDIQNLVDGYFDCVTLPNNECLYVNDEGLIDGTDFGFYLAGRPFAGKGVILGFDPSTGDSTPTKLTPETVLSEYGLKSYKEVDVLVFETFPITENQTQNNTHNEKHN
jgi:hypothetical protein